MAHLRDPALRVKVAVILLVVCFIGWPTTALTIFRDEPQGILGLSWMALILTALDILATTEHRQATDDEDVNPDRDGDGKAG